mmetsp:Transcript_19953/g.28072  ORF Transcript_19953/g.28072 Transcript_19953/m.28072 type:complete len:189 (-) Transcript_19953:47-613(-)
MDDIDEHGDIGIHLVSLHAGHEEEEEDYGDGSLIVIAPPMDERVVRIDFDGGFLFRACPRDHACLRDTVDVDTVHDIDVDDVDKKGEDEKKEETETNKKRNMDEKILVSFSMCVDPKMKFLPQSFLNFIMRTAIGTIWKMFLRVAEDVKNGKRPEHAKAIERKRETLYDWVDERVNKMLSSMNPNVVM